MNSLQIAHIDATFSSVEVYLRNYKKLEAEGKSSESLLWDIRKSIAFFSLANDYYYYTPKMLKHAKKHNIEFHKRNRKSIKNRYTFEHPIPSKVILNEILKNPTKEYVEKILKMSDRVVMLTHDENKLLVKAKLISSMPKSWKFGDDIYSRYNTVGIKVIDEPIKMIHALTR